MAVQVRTPDETGEVYARRLLGILGRFGSEHLLNEGTLLDLGCGYGNITAAFQRTYPNARVVGLDFYPRLAKDSRKRKGDHLQLVQTDLKKAAIRDDSVDVAFSRQIYNLYNEDAYPEIAREVFRMLKHGGIYVVFDADMPKFGQPLKDLGMEVLEDDYFYLFLRKRRSS